SVVIPRPPTSTLVPYTTLFRSSPCAAANAAGAPSSSSTGGGSGTAPSQAKKSRAACASSRLPTTTAIQSVGRWRAVDTSSGEARSEEHTSELQSRENLVCRLLL